MARLWRGCIVYQSRGPKVGSNQCVRTNYSVTGKNQWKKNQRSRRRRFLLKLCSVFALFYSVLLSTSADCRKTHPVARTSPVFTILFWLVFVRINSAASDATSARLSGGYRPVRSICFSGHFRQCPFLSHYFDRNWISSDAFLCILSATVFSLGVYHFQRGATARKHHNLKPKKGWKWI